MKKIVDDWKLIHRVCCLYYNDDMRQQEICDYLGISRASVSRMLQKGKDTGIVKIHIADLVQKSYGKLEEQLKEKYGLKDVVIVEGSALDTKNETITKLSERSAIYLSEFFEDGDVVGVTMGYTLHNIAMTKMNFDKKNIEFVPCIGGISPVTVNSVDVQSNQIAREYASKFGGTFTQFLAPALFSRKKVKDYFLEEESVNFIFDDLKRINTLVMGIGSITTTGTDRTLIESGYITKDEIDDLVDNGAVGNVILQFFDKDGKSDKFKDFNDRVARISNDTTFQIENRIGIGGGIERVEGVKAAIAGGYINILVTTNECAEKLL